MDGHGNTLKANTVPSVERQEGVHKASEQKESEHQMPTYRQNDQKNLAVQKPLQFGKPAGQEGGAIVRIAGGPLELGFTLDTSQSMQHLYEAAAIGFNSFVAEQYAAGSGFLSFNCFASTVHHIFAGLELGQVQKIDRGFLAERAGATALLDGIGSIIQSVASRFDKLPAPRRGALVAILTDGAENSSSRFSKQDIFQMIHYRRSVHHWEFLFICADEAGEAYGLSLGIQKANICRFDTSPEGIKLLLDRLSKAARAYRFGDRNFAGFLTDATA